MDAGEVGPPVLIPQGQCGPDGADTRGGQGQILEPIFRGRGVRAGKQLLVGKIMSQLGSVGGSLMDEGVDRFAGQAIGIIGPLRPGGGGCGEQDQFFHALAPEQPHISQRNRPAHRKTDQGEAAQAKAEDDTVQVGGHLIEGVYAVWGIRGSKAPEIQCDHPIAAFEQPPDLVFVHLMGKGPAVEQDHGFLPAGIEVIYRQPGAVGRFYDFQRSSPP